MSDALDDTTAAGDVLAGKRPLIQRSATPPVYETPLELLGGEFTANDSFFVRYHLAEVPLISAEEWRLRIGGDAASTTRELTLEELRRDFEQVEVAAVCQCAGNKRSLFETPPAGVPWGCGAIGNAVWRGVRLKDVLAEVGVNEDALEITLNGADRGTRPGEHAYAKSLPPAKAFDEHTIIAFEMNGETLPLAHGFPARAVVPGWSATFWTKHLDEIAVLSEPLRSHWMNPDYRIPLGKFPVVERFFTQEDDESAPITEIAVNSLITNIEDGREFRCGETIGIKGVAWDGGYNIERVEVSTDGGAKWAAARLEPQAGRFAWRRWSYDFVPAEARAYTIMCRATNGVGATQVAKAVPNRGGYQNNEIQRLRVSVV